MIHSAWAILYVVVMLIVYAKGFRSGRRDYRYELRGRMHQGGDVENFLEFDDDV